MEKVGTGRNTTLMKVWFVVACKVVCKFSVNHNVVTNL